MSRKNTSLGPSLPTGSHNNQLPIIRHSTFYKIRGRVIYVFLGMLLLQISYPVSLINKNLDLIYLCSYALVLGGGIYAARVNRLWASLAIISAIAVIGFGVPWNIWIYDPLWIIVGTFVSLMTFQLILIIMLGKFISISYQVNNDVLLAAITIFLVLGNLFTSAFMIIQTFDPDAFISDIYTTPIRWQRVIYYSYSTLTTLGYGDISPRNAFAQSLSSLEAMTGLIYIATIISKLVAIHQSTSFITNGKSGRQ